MDRQQVAGRRRPRPIADLLHLARPSDHEGLLSPHAFEQRAIGALRRAIDKARDVRQAHLHRVGRRPLRLLGGRIAEPAAGRAHVPEIAADKIALATIVVQYRRERRVGVRLRLAVAEPRPHRAGISGFGPVQLGYRTGKAGLRHVAERARLVAVHRELLVVEDQFAQQFNLLDLVVGRRRQPFERLRLDAVDLGLDLRDLLQRLGRERCTGFLRARAGCAGEGGCCNRKQQEGRLHAFNSGNRDGRTKRGRRCVTPESGRTRSGIEAPRCL